MKKKAENSVLSILGLFPAVVWVSHLDILLESTNFRVVKPAERYHKYSSLGTH